MKCDALVGYAWCRSSYTAIRSLSRFGLSVAVADSTRFGMGQRSKHTATHYVHANPQTDPEQFIEDIIRILKECKAHFYLPGHDEGTIVAQHRSRLPKEVVVPLIDYDTLTLANDKMRTAEMASKLDIPTPRAVHYQSVDELKDILAKTDKPKVVKLRRGCGAKGVFYANSSEQAVSMVNRLIEQYNLLPENAIRWFRNVYRVKAGVCLASTGEVNGLPHLHTVGCVRKPSVEGQVPCVSRRIIGR